MTKVKYAHIAIWVKTAHMAINIANWATDVLQNHKRVIGASSITGLILTLGRSKAPLSLPKQPDQSLSFADNKKNNNRY